MTILLKLVLDSFWFSVSLITLYNYLWYPFFFVTLSQLSCFFCVHYTTFHEHNFETKLFVGLKTWLSYKMIHQSVKYFWITTTKVINHCSFWWIHFLFLAWQSFFWREPQIISSFLFIANSFSLYTSNKTISGITSRSSTVCLEKVDGILYLSLTIKISSKCI